MWDNFLKTQPNQKDTNLVNVFKEEYKKEVQRITQIETGVLSDADVPIRISHITFAFDNVQLLKLLQRRGMLVTVANHEKVKQVD